MERLFVVKGVDKGVADRRIGKKVRFNRNHSQTNETESLDQLFSIFYDAKVAEGRSDRTLETYRENYRFFIDYLDSNQVERKIKEVSPTLIRSYITWMLKTKRKWEGHKHKSEANMTQGLSPVTVNTRLKGLRTMFRFLMNEGLIDNNPFDSVKPVREPENDIKIMTAEELKKLLREPNQRSYAGYRDYVLMNLLIDGFLRIGEAIGLKKTDIDFNSGTIFLSGRSTKSRRSRIVPLQRHTMNHLRDLIKESEEFDSEYVFLTNYGESITDDQVRNRLKEHAKSAGLNIRVYPHLFRHTAATLFIENGGSLSHLQRIMGHNDLRMVVKYTHLSQKSVISEHSKFSPLNQVINKLQRPRKTKIKDKKK